MAAVELTLLSKPGCHLCDDAREIVTVVIDEVRGALAASGPAPGTTPQITLSELSILDDPALFDAYAEEIPVLLINGRVHTIWRVDPARLTAALNTALKELA